MDQCDSLNLTHFCVALLMSTQPLKTPKLTSNIEKNTLISSISCDRLKRRHFASMYLLLTIFY